MKPYKGSPYAIVKDEWWMDPDACDHPLCERLHSKNGCPAVRRVEWLIIEICSGDRFDLGDAYALRRDAVRVLEEHLKRQEALANFVDSK